MTIDFFKSEKIIRLTPIVRESQMIANKSLEGDIRVFPNLSNVKVNDFSELWEMKFETSPSTYSLYVYALYPISYLLNSYEVTQDVIYLDEAVRVSIEFVNWELRDDKNISAKRKEILFGDHAVSNRTQTLCYLTVCLKNENRNIPNKIIDALLRNGKYLADSDNYRQYNHGLMMDLSLLGLINTLEGLEIDYSRCFKDSLISRLQESISRDLSEDGVHVENSPGYHFWMLGFLERIKIPLESLDENLSARANDILVKANEYAKYITRPDGSVPTIGDTHAGVKFTPSRGLSSRFFNYSNQVFFRDSSDKIWAHFGCGYKTHVHKHSDNGAFNLYYKSDDLFIDPGFLNYESTDDSQLIRTAGFHNTVMFKGEEQIISKVDLSQKNISYDKNISDSKIISYDNLGDIETAIAKICEYSSGYIERRVIWMKPNCFLISDKAEIKKGLEQVFHISPKMIVEKDKGVVSILNPANEIICSISQLNYKTGDEVDIQECFFSVGFGKKALSKKVVFNSSGGEFLTLIKLFNYYD